MQIKNHGHCSTYFFLTRLFLMGTRGISHLLPFPWKLIDLQFESRNTRFEGIPYFYTCICFALLTKRWKRVGSIPSSFLSWTKSSFMEPLWPSPQMFGALWFNRACGSFPGLFNLLQERIPQLPGRNFYLKQSQAFPYLFSYCCGGTWVL